MEAREEVPCEVCCRERSLHADLDAISDSCRQAHCYACHVKGESFSSIRQGLVSVAHSFGDNEIGKAGFDTFLTEVWLC